MLGGRAHRDTEIGTDGVSLIVRSIPLRPQGDHIGALVLVRDVTDLRRRDRELVTKDATIREIHHRVKNNLQTVAALLRLQARRMDSESARLGARGGGPPGRLDRDRPRDPEPGGRGAGRLRRDRRPARPDGHRGERGRQPGAGAPRRHASACCPPRSATALAMVLTELLQNAVEHGYDPDDAEPTGRDRADARSGWSAGCTSRSTTTVAGCPTASTWTRRRSLGLSIVRTLVESELGGQLELGPAPGRGRAPGPRSTCPVE